MLNQKVLLLAHAQHSKCAQHFLPLLYQESNVLTQQSYAAVLVLG